MATSTNQITCKWEDERAEIVSIQVYPFSETARLLVTLDDMG
jgi:hypothetical protein